ncbi:adenosine receptor A1-like [Diadema setosum]|uniref:adenosine receptor A1-like n=1 Tax=Diadema setosum TaxID=31175 RepID=UPI003B3AC670
METPLHRSLMIVAFAPLAIVIVIGNALVMLAVRREPTLREPSHLLLACLALADLLTGLVAIPVEVFSRIVRSHVTCTLGTAVYFTMWSPIFSGVSYVVIVLVNVDRYVAISRPLRYVSMVTSRRVVMVIVAVWVINLMHGFMFALWFSGDQFVIKYCTLGTLEPTGRENMEIRQLPRKFVDVLTTIGTVIAMISLVVICSCNLRILTIAKAQARRIQMAARDHPMGFPPPGPKLKKEVKAIRAILLILFIFCITSSPSWIWGVVEYFFDVSYLASFLASNINFFLQSISSAANPFIYCVKNPFFRKALRKMLTSLFRWLDGNKVNVDLEQSSQNLR